MVTERDDLTAEGLRCRPCSMRSEIETHERNIVEERELKRQRSMRRRASVIGWAHSVVWVCLAELLVPRGVLRDAAWLLAIGVRIALFWRQRWALRLALGIDAATIAVCLGLAISDGAADTLLGAAIFSFFPLVLGLLLYSQRRAYEPENKPAPVDAPPPQKWSAPGRQL